MTSKILLRHFCAVSALLLCIVGVMNVAGTKKLYQSLGTFNVENSTVLSTLSGTGDAQAGAQAVRPVEIYDLFAGVTTPEKVLEATRAGMPSDEALKGRLFYAHLYLGLYYETEGDPTRALEHLNRATDEHRIGHYMGDVARVHRDLLKKAANK